MLKTEKYFDIGCARCGFHRSTDFEMGMDEVSAIHLRKMAQAEGWTSIDGKGNVCPKCVEEASVTRPDGAE